MSASFGERLKSLRIERGMSQEELADILETSKQVISRYEKNQRTPKITVVNEYAQKLDVPLAYLLGSDGISAGSNSDNDSIHAVPEHDESYDTLKRLIEEAKSGKGDKTAVIMVFDGDKQHQVSTFPDRLREALENTQASKVAENIGISKQDISMYATGKRSPKRLTIKALARELNISPAWLLGYDVPKELEKPIPKDEPFLDPLDEEIIKGLSKLSPRDKAAIIAQIKVLSNLE